MPIKRSITSLPREYGDGWRSSVLRLVRKTAWLVRTLTPHHVPLIVLHGRDEFLDRPTLDVARHGDCVCGLDSVHQGTWCGVNVRSGQAVFLTNFRTEDLQPPPYSRGRLVMDLLMGIDPFDGGKKRREEFGPHNVLSFNVYDLEAPALYESSSTALKREPLTAGVVHVLSNSVLDDFSWPKVRWLRDEAARVAASLGNVIDEGVVVAALSELLMNDADHPYADEASIPGTARERLLRGRVFLHNLGGRYGTRSQTVLVQRRDARGTYRYRSIDVETGKPRDWMCWDLPGRVSE